MASKEQTIIYDFIKSKWNNTELIQDYRPKCMINHLSGNNLEIDIFCREYKIGFEYQGKIHFKNIKEYGNNSDYSRNNDVLKRDITDNLKGRFVLIEIFYSDLIGDLSENIYLRCLNTGYYYLNKNILTKARLCFFLALCFKYSTWGFRLSCSGIFLFSDDKRCILQPDELKAEVRYYKYLTKKYLKY